MGRRFGPDNAWGLRVNGSCRNGDTNIDDGKQEFGLMALALDYRSTQLRWSVDAHAQKEETDPFRAQTGLRPGIAFIPKAPSGRRAVYDGADLALRDVTIASRLEYDLSPDLMLYAAAGYHYGASEQDFPSARGMDAAATPDDVGNTLPLPSWTRVDLGARYRAMIMGKQAALRASVENVFNQNCWLSSSTLLTVGTAAAPRTVLLSAQFDLQLADSRQRQGRDAGSCAARPAATGRPADRHRR